MITLCRGLLASLALLVGLAALPASAKELTSSDIRKYKAQLSNFAKGERVDALKGLIEELSALDHEEVAPLIPIAGTAVASYDNFQAAVKGIVSLENEKAIEALVEMVEGKGGDYRPRILIIEAFALREDAPSGAAIATMIEKSASHVQLAAIRAARKRRHKDSIPKLIDVVEKHQAVRDREFYEAYTALIDLTGLDFESLDDWKKWWEASGPSFDPASVTEKKDGTSIELKRADDSVEFFGKEVFSRNLLFVIDISGSMQAKDPSEPDRNRLERAKAQLAKAIKYLKRGTRFNIIAYSDKIVPWKKSLQLSKRSAIKSAIAFVKRLQFNGLTYTDDALKEAFKDLRVDTIILLSDGFPQKAPQGGDHEMLIGKILKWVKDNNSSRKVKIDTFGFGDPGGDGNPLGQFLKKLAEDHGGTYRPIP